MKHITNPSPSIESTVSSITTTSGMQTRHHKHDNPLNSLQAWRKASPIVIMFHKFLVYCAALRISSSSGIVSCGRTDVGGLKKLFPSASFMSRHCGEEKNFNESGDFNLSQFVDKSAHKRGKNVNFNLHNCGISAIDFSRRSFSLDLVWPDSRRRIKKLSLINSSASPKPENKFYFFFQFAGARRD